MLRELDEAVLDEAGIGWLDIEDEADAAAMLAAKLKLTGDGAPDNEAGAPPAGDNMLLTPPLPPIGPQV